MKEDEAAVSYSSTREAIESAYRYKNYVFKSLASKFGAYNLRDREEDIVQQAFMIAWQTADKYRGETPVLRWITAIAIYQACREISKSSTASIDSPDFPAFLASGDDKRIESEHDLQKVLGSVSLTPRQLDSINYFLENGSHVNHSTACGYHQSVEKMRRVVGTQEGPRARARRLKLFRLAGE